MDMEKTLAASREIDVILGVCNYVQQSEEELNKLIELILKGEKKVGERASWVLTKLADTHPELISPYLNKLLSHLKNSANETINRNIIRCLENIDPEKTDQDLAFEICYQYFENKSNPIAVRVFAMSFLSKIALKYPEFREELILLIEDEMPYASPAFKSRGMKVLKLLKTPSGRH